MARARIAGVLTLLAAVAAGLIVAVSGSKNSSSVSANGAASQEATQAAVSAGALVSVPTPTEEQVARIENWYRDAPADAPNGRPVLGAEVTFCDSGSGERPFVFASYSNLRSQLTQDALVDGCMRSKAVAEYRAAHPDADPVLCAGELRGPIYDPARANVTAVSKPVVAFGIRSCAEARYADADQAFLAAMNARRNAEIQLRAVPSSCRSSTEAIAWAEQVSATYELGLTVSKLDRGPLSEPACFTHMYVDWDARIVEVA